MSQENVEAVRRGHAAWERGDLEEALAAFDEAVVIRPIIGPTWHGREGLLEMAADWTEGLDNWTMAAEEFIDAGDRVVVRVHQTGKGEASGVPITADYWFVYTVDDGKVVRMDMYADRNEALEAARLSDG
jgi:ketosteroid isomerase-like protein